MIDVVGTRLRTQHLVGRPLSDAVAVVRRFGALQAQDYPAAVWAIAQRTGLVRAEVDAAYQAGHLIRTHVLRPTWHLVAPEDLRWMLELTSPRVHQANGPIYRQVGLDAATLARGEELVVAALDDGPKTRPQLGAALEERGFPASGLRLGYVLMAAELDRLICSGGLLGTTHAYVRFDGRVPPEPTLERDAALRELAARYYRGHGPATVRDLAWWSGLTLGDARRATAFAEHQLERGIVDERELWWEAGAGEPATTSDRSARRIHLLPNYDEYTVAYRDRDDLTNARTGELSELLLARHIVLVDGLVSGGWRNVNTAKEHVLEVRLAVDRTPELEAGIRVAADWYGRVNGVAVRVEHPS